MAKRNLTPAAEQVTGVDLSAGPDKTVIVWKATRPLTVQEHEDLSNKLRHEMEAAGIPIILVPFTVEVEEAAQEPSNDE